jgi:MurNAc alpha-1-phosphate uridylyltransferase
MLIEYHLHALSAAGYGNIVINIGHLGQQLMDKVGDGSRYGLSIHYSDERGNVLETGGGICKALPLLKSEYFLVINGDVWTDFDLSTLSPCGDSLAHLVLVNNPPHHPDGDFGLDHGKVMEKTPGRPAWTYSGTGVFSHKLFEACPAGRFPLAPLLRQHMAEKRVSGELYEGKWLDVGTVERLKQLDRQLSAGLAQRPE